MLWSVDGRPAKACNTVLADFEFPIIETYTQLAWVMLVVSGALVLGGCVARRARQTRAARRAGVKSAPVAAPPTPIQRTGPGPRPLDFERLAALISEASDRAWSITETQAAVGIKLDSTEIAVSRLVTDLGEVKWAPQRLRAPGSTAPAEPRTPASARPLMPLPDLSASAA